MSRSLRPFLAVTAVFLVLAAAALSGALDFLVPDGSISRKRAVATLAFYWPVACAAVYVLLGWRRHWRNCLLAAAASAGALLLGEGALRVFLPMESMLRFRALTSSRYHHRYPPGRRMFAGHYGDRPVLVETNEDGLRTSHSRAAFLGRGTRIAVLGDSFAFGAKVRQEAVFTVVLEGLLKERSPGADAAVLNAGIVSHSPFLENIFFDGVVKEYRPTLTMLLLDATDVGDDVAYVKEAREEGGAVRFPKFADQPDPGYHGAVAELLRAHVAELVEPVRLVFPFPEIRDRLKPWYDYYDFRLEIGGAVETNRFFIYRHPLEETRPYFEATFANVKAIAASARAIGSEFVLVIAPRFHHWDPAECPRNWERFQYRVDEPHQFELFRFFEEKRAESGFEILDLLPAFRAARERPLVFEDDPHWNEAGHALVARTLADHLSRW